jgi:hypothetical protein
MLKSLEMPAYPDGSRGGLPAYPDTSKGPCHHTRTSRSDRCHPREGGDRYP